LTGQWTVSAYQRDHGRLAKPVTVTGTGQTDVEALRDLDDRLRGVPQPDGGRTDELRRRVRLAYIAGEQWTHAEVGRSMTAEELEAVAASFPGHRG